MSKDANRPKGAQEWCEASSNTRRDCDLSLAG